MDMTILKIAEVDLIWFAIYTGMVASVLTVIFILYGIIKGDL
jgi:hypothetical protein